jgi:hypothetical protein
VFVFGRAGGDDDITGRGASPWALMLGNGKDVCVVALLSLLYEARVWVGGKEGNAARGNTREGGGLDSGWMMGRAQSLLKRHGAG